MTKSEVFAQLFSFSWPRPVELVEYANSHHGFMGDDGYYGVTYPSDLDEYQIQIEGEFIPKGFVEIHYWDGDFKDLQVSEQEYLGMLWRHLVSIGHGELSHQLLHAQPGISSRRLRRG